MQSWVTQSNWRVCAIPWWKGIWFVVSAFLSIFIQFSCVLHSILHQQMLHSSSYHLSWCVVFCSWFPAFEHAKFHYPESKCMVRHVWSARWHWHAAVARFSVLAWWRVFNLSKSIDVQFDVAVFTQAGYLLVSVIQVMLQTVFLRRFTATSLDIYRAPRQWSTFRSFLLRFCFGLPYRAEFLKFHILIWFSI